MSDLDSLLKFDRNNLEQGTFYKFMEILQELSKIDEKFNLFWIKIH
jgi:hypothetical protein